MQLLPGHNTSVSKSETSFLDRNWAQRNNACELPQFRTENGTVREWVFLAAPRTIAEGTPVDITYRRYLQ